MPHRFLHLLGGLLILLAVVITLLYGLGIIHHLSEVAAHPPAGTLVEAQGSVINTLALFLPWILLLGLYVVGFRLVRARRTLPPR